MTLSPTRSSSRGTSKQSPSLTRRRILKLSLLLAGLPALGWQARPAHAAGSQPVGGLLAVRQEVPAEDTAGAAVLIPSAPPSGPGLLSPSSSGSYVVEAGDTLSSIARRHGVSVEALVAANQLGDVNTLREGQKLVIPAGSIQALTTSSSEASNQAVPSPSPKPSPSPGPGTPTLINGTQPGLTATPAASPSVNVTTSRISQMAWPLQVNAPTVYVSQEFNAGHRAIDVAAPEGTPIKAMSGGVVKMAEKTATAYGWMVQVDHGDNVSTWYAHLSAFSVKPGDRVQMGEKLGEVGSTGRATGSHLHFELRVSQTPINPKLVLS
jgi:murein DD-endopeptidase MepM/ murein hydrolase activator NlpD